MYLAASAIFSGRGTAAALGCHHLPVFYIMCPGDSPKIMCTTNDGTGYDILNNFQVFGELYLPSSYLMACPMIFPRKTNISTWSGDVAPGFGTYRSRPMPAAWTPFGVRISSGSALDCAEDRKAPRRRGGRRYAGSEREGAGTAAHGNKPRIVV